MEQKKLLEISDDLLDLLLDFKKDNPDFTFSLRERDSPQAKDVKRLEKGQWFQGSDYIYVPLFRKGDNARKIKTIGFVVGSNKEGEQTNYIEVSFKKGNFTNEEISFHKELSEIFDIKLNNENVGYFQFDDPKNYIKNLAFYLNEFRSKALELLKSYKLEERFLITEDNFQKRLKKINEIKKVLGDPSYSVNNRNTIIKESDENIMKQSINQILYGPPGTGKTYLAKQIAKQLIGVKTDQELEESGQFAFVQFHPSYDYTDFVEGLRPTPPDDNGNIGFELKDGIFKAFCQKAAEAKYLDTLDNFDEAWNKLIEDVRNNMLKGKLTEIGKWEYSLNSNNNLKYNSTNTPSQYYFSITKKNVHDAYHGRKARPSGAFQKDMHDVVQYLIKKYQLKELAATIENNDKASKNFVFVIDEINRGEVSKIFGELFFSIDPSYRGKKGAVKTQYSNLHNDENELFYVPENVYIIGSMNDIDRSVESFDFAMRRRFTWIEITAEDSAENMNLPDNLKEKMLNLNTQISITDGLNASYHIGAAYFLDSNGAVITDINSNWKHRIEPLLKEYLRGMPDFADKMKLLQQAFFA